MTDDDSRLLSAYVRERSEAAFGELVQRHLTLVYSAALRQTDGDAHRARDVAQIVFTTLAREAATLHRHPTLTGWLYTVTRHTAIDLIRSERRRQKREKKAMSMEDIAIASGSETTADWEQLRPVLDTAMGELDARDREAVLLRFFEEQPFAGVASALRVSEDAARKRVDRALAKLGEALARRGITSTGGALAVLLANQVAVAAPAGVAASITTTALAATGAGAVAGGLGAGAAGVFIMSTTKTVTGIAAVIAAVAIGAAIYEATLARDSASLRSERDALSRRLATMEQRSKQADESLATTRKELSALKAEATKPAAMATPASDKPGSQGAAMDYLLEHPEMQATFLQQMELRGKMRYNGFFKSAGLSAEQQDQVMKVFDDIQATQMDIMSALHVRGYGVGNMPQDAAGQQMLQKMTMELKERVDTGMRSVLGDDGYKSFQQYSALIPERNVADQLASQLYDTSEPLTSTQADQLVQVLAQNRFTPQSAPSPSATLNGTFIDAQAYGRRRAQEMQQNGMSMLNWSAPVTDPALSRAEAVLTPGQLAALRQVQAQQALQFQLAPPPAGQKAPADSK